MQSNADTRPEHQMPGRIRRIAEGALMLGAALVGLWLLAAMATFFFK